MKVVYDSESHMLSIAATKASLISTDDPDTTNLTKREKKQQKKLQYHSWERSFGSSTRSLAIPEDADTSNIQAKFNNGVLTITIPRIAKAETDAEGVPKKSNLKEIDILA